MSCQGVWGNAPGCSILKRKNNFHRNPDYTSWAKGLYFPAVLDLEGTEGEHRRAATWKCYRQYALLQKTSQSTILLGSYALLGTHTDTDQNIHSHHNLGIDIKCQCMGNQAGRFATQKIGKSLQISNCLNPTYRHKCSEAMNSRACAPTNPHLR